MRAAFLVGFTTGFEEREVRARLRLLLLAAVCAFTACSAFTATAAELTEGWMRPASVSFIDDIFSIRVIPARTQRCMNALFVVSLSWHAWR